MRLLLDTHAFIWLTAGDKALSNAAREVIDNPENDVFISAATVWEIATKYRIGRLNVDSELVRDLQASVARLGFLGLPVTLAHAQRAGALPGPHADPFDRMLISQAMGDDLVLVSNERPFDFYGVKRLW